jgi:hypothetical protein
LEKRAQKPDALFGKKRAKNPNLLESLKDYYNTLKNIVFGPFFLKRA